MTGTKRGRARNNGNDDVWDEERMVREGLMYPRPRQYTEYAADIAALWWVRCFWCENPYSDAGESHVERCESCEFLVCPICEGCSPRCEDNPQKLPVHLPSVKQVRTKQTVRVEIRPRLRFYVLDRDEFTCQYCGVKAPDAVLVIDHRIPIASGGTNDESNLVTACVRCNAGKSDRLLKADRLPLEPF